MSEQDIKARRNWVKQDVAMALKPHKLVAFELVEDSKGVEWNGKRVRWNVIQDLSEDELLDLPWHFSVWRAWDSLEESESRNTKFQESLSLGKRYKGFMPMPPAQ